MGYNFATGERTPDYGDMMVDNPVSVGWTTPRYTDFDAASATTFDNFWPTYDFSTGGYTSPGDDWYTSLLSSGTDGTDWYSALGGDSGEFQGDWMRGSEGVIDDGTGSVNTAGIVDKLLGIFKTNGDYDLSKLGLGGLGGLGMLGALLDNEPQTEARTLSQSATMPSWYTDAAKGALASAADLPKYQQFFGGPGSALGFSGALAPGAVPSGGGSAPGVDMGLQQFMNPYWQSALVPQENKIRQDQALSQNALNDQLIKAGAFGGSRTAVAQALNEQEGNRRVDDLYATGAKSAFDSAIDLAGTDITRRWQDYMNSIQSPVTNQAALTSALTGIKVPMTQDSVSTLSKSPESPWKALMGTGSTLWSLANPNGLGG